MIWLVALLVGVGMFFQVLGTVALFRFPDVYTRLHGTTKCTTFGSIFVYLGVIVYALSRYLSGGSGYLTFSVHTLAAMLLILLTNPVGAHAIARAAHRSGVMPKHAVVDDLKEGKR